MGNVIEPAAAYTIGGSLLLVALVMFRPARKLLKLAVNSSIGCAALLLFNWIGGHIGMSIGVNIFTALTIGALGLPGFTMLFVLQLIYL